MTPPKPQTILFDLPFPPSTNTYYRHPTTGALAGRHLISKRGRLYLEECIPLLIVQMRKAGFKKQSGFVYLEIALYPPTRQWVDTDNTEKAVFDAMTRAGVYDDDRLVDDHRTYRARDDNFELLIENRIQVLIKPLGYFPPIKPVRKKR